MKGLKAKLAFALIGTVAGVLVLVTLVMILETHYHFLQYQEQVPVHDLQMMELNRHFEMALIQSICWIAAGSLALAITVSLWIAKRITAPLVEMRKVAEQIVLGNHNNRVSIAGEDELADLGRALNHLTEQLERQEMLRKNLTADVAHELRTPLANLKSFMEAFEDGIWEPTPERIRSCHEEIDRLTRLVDDLHQLTRLESSEFQLEMVEAELTTIVKQSMTLMEPLFIQKGVKLQLEMEPPIWIKVDPKRMSQIIHNLLSNALKFTPAGGKVTIRADQNIRETSLTVTDTGMGIPQDELSKIFERFYRVEKSRSRDLGGAGIGLTIVKKLVEAHVGTIEIESKEKVGTSVTVRIPIIYGSSSSDLHNSSL